MGAVAVHPDPDAIMDAAPEGAIELFHGYTLLRHPAACAAGLATLDIYRNDGLFEPARRSQPTYRRDLLASDHPPCVCASTG